MAQGGGAPSWSQILGLSVAIENNLIDTYVLIICFCFLFVFLFLWSDIYNYLTKCYKL